MNRVVFFPRQTGKDAESFKGKAKDFAEALNKGDADLRVMFRDAVEECEPSDEEVGTMGLGSLFNGIE